VAAQSNKQLSVLISSTFAFTICFAIWMMFAVLGIPIKANLGLNETQFGLLAAMPVLTGSLVRVPLGIWTDKYGGRIVFFLLMLSSVVPIYLISYATAYWHFLVLGLFVGLAGGSFSVGTPYVARWFQQERRGLAMGIFGAGNSGSALTKFIEDDKVFAIVGHFGTPVVAATIGTLKESGIPAVYFATGIGQLYAESAKTDAEGANLFPVQPIYRNEGGIMSAYATGKFSAKKIGIIYTNDDAGMDLEKGAVAQIKTMSGIEYVEQQVAAGAPDVSSAVTAIKNANVDFVIIAAIQATMPTIVKELASQGVNKDAITTYVNVSSAMSKAVIADINGKFNLYGPGWVDYSSDTAKAALKEYQAGVDAKYATNAYAQTGWIAATFFVEGLKRLKGKTVTWDSYKKALEQAPIQNPFGGSIDFSNGQRKGTQEMNLAKVVPTDTANPSGWQQVEPLQSISKLLGK